jgi:TetR/AcrR family transcriptional repressor of nem operon
MKVTKERSAEIRATLIETAGRLFRERGIDGVGIAEICKQAGLTHGALYAHFPNKQSLVAEALAHGLESGHKRLTRKEKGNPPTLSRYLDYYLSHQMRDNLAENCAIAASVSEIARQDETTRMHFCNGAERLVAAIEPTLGHAKIDATNRERALLIVAALIGGVAIARGSSKEDPGLSEEMLSALRKILGEIGGE